MPAEPEVSWRAGYVVRRDWPDGSHDLVRLSIVGDDLPDWIASDRTYWRRGPVRPTHSVVVVSVRDFELHQDRRLCRSSDCPTENDTVPVLAGDAEGAAR